MRTREIKAPAAQRPHGLTLEGRERAVITGVEEVDSFNEQMVVLLTSVGMLTLLGDDLHVSKLNLEDGKLLVEGRIAAFEYDDNAKGSRGKFFSRLFR